MEVQCIDDDLINNLFTLREYNLNGIRAWEWHNDESRKKKFQRILFSGFFPQRKKEISTILNCHRYILPLLFARKEYLYVNNCWEPFDGINNWHLDPLWIKSNILRTVSKPLKLFRTIYDFLCVYLRFTHVNEKLVFQILNINQHHSFPAHELNLLKASHISFKLGIAFCWKQTVIYL